MNATRRGVRRSSISGRQQSRAESLSAICAALDRAGAKYQLDGFCRGSRILIGQMKSGAGVTLTFAHPTKCSTAARYAFLRTSHAALMTLNAPAEKVST